MLSTESNCMLWCVLPALLCVMPNPPYRCLVYEDGALGFVTQVVVFVRCVCHPTWGKALCGACCNTHELLQVSHTQCNISIA